MKIKQRAIFFLLICLFALPTPRPLTAAVLPGSSGEIKFTEVIQGETLMEVARRTGFGFENVANANPTVDPWLPVPGTGVTLPGLCVLPYGVRPGLTINLAELRLFHLYNQDTSFHVQTYPLGIGREGRHTPEGQYSITTKRVNPIWRVPEGLRDSDPSLPRLVDPGPDNPLGSYWLGLSVPGYGIHGTNRPLGVGRRVSYGCLRMYPEQVKELFPKIPIGTPVQIVYQPIKAGWVGNNLLLEVHPDYLEKYSDLFQEAMTVISKVGAPTEIDYLRVKEIVEQQTGIPQAVGRR